MRRFIVLVVLCASVLVTVSGCFRDLLLDNTETEEEYEEIKTYLRFVNDGKFSVDVFLDPTRLSKLCTVEAGGNKVEEVVPDPTSNTYYLDYKIPFHGAALIHKGSMVVHVPAQKTTNGIIPLLSHLSESEQQRKITEDVYVFVNNTSSLSLSLRRSNTPIYLDGTSSDTLNSKSRGFYILPSSYLVISTYIFSRNTAEVVPWPAELTDAGSSFAKGYLYSFNFPSTNLVFDGKWEMTIANALAALEEE
jgi:hypothetical protein